MSFIRTKLIKGHLYYYLVESVREGGKVRQKILKYFGTTRPEPKYYLMLPKASEAKRRLKGG